MKDFLKIFKWFERNMFKLIFILIVVFIIFIIVMLLMPIFQIIGFVGEGVNEFQNIFETTRNNLKSVENHGRPTESIGKIPKTILSTRVNYS